MQLVKKRQPPDNGFPKQAKKQKKETLKPNAREESKAPKKVSGGGKRKRSSTPTSKSAPQLPQVQPIDEKSSTRERGKSRPQRGRTKNIKFFEMLKEAGLIKRENRTSEEAKDEQELKSLEKKLKIKGNKLSSDFLEDGFDCIFGFSILVSKVLLIIHRFI